MPVPADLQDIVNNPRETLTVEIKERLDLTDPERRAQVARHLCALANHGGGYLVFGFDNNGQPVVAPPDIAERYHQDQIAGIIAKYLFIGEFKLPSLSVQLPSDSPILPRRRRPTGIKTNRLRKTQDRSF